MKMTLILSVALMVLAATGCQKGSGEASAAAPEVGNAAAKKEFPNDVELDPSSFAEGAFQEHTANLIQINVRGRILQVSFYATPELVSTEDFRVPYTLEGCVRAFNQELLEKDLIEEQLLFYTLENAKKMWRFFDARTYRSGPFDQEYLIGLMEQLI